MPDAYVQLPVEPQRTKAQRTRAKIRAAALELFSEAGYERTTLRQIAKRADCSLGLTYRYFRSKDDLVLSLYKEVCEQFMDVIAAAPPGTLGVRFRDALLAKLEILEPYRAVLGSAAVYSAALTPDAPVAVLGRATQDLRAESLRSLQELVESSSNAPKDVPSEDMAMVLYAGLLLVLLYWFNDPTAGQSATRTLIEESQEMVDALPLITKLGPVRKRLGTVANLLFPVFGAEESVSKRGLV